jgi:lipopolysaccharide/colanic/teichoic acid biosynthesis glycosyltransferase
MTYPSRHNLHATNKLKNTPLAAQPSRPGRNSIPAFVKANGPSDIMQYGFAAMSLALLAPLFLIIGLLIKFTSQGLILDRGLRLGKDGRMFTIYTFRTLQVGAEEKVGSRLLTGRDAYCICIGKFLKRTKLDELPQPVNILKGEMNTPPHLIS